jgi:hypothetical protein
MQQTKSSITHLVQEIEAFAEQVGSFPELSEKLGHADLKAVRLQGLSLKSWLEKLWPDLDLADSPALNRLLLKKQAQYYTDNIRARQTENTKLRQQADQARNRLKTEVDQAGIDLNQAKKRLKGLTREMENLRNRAFLIQKNQARLLFEKHSLDSWLKGLSPKGLAGFIDANGQEVKKAVIRESTQRQQALTQKSVQLLEQQNLTKFNLSQLKQEIRQANRTREQAESRLRELETRKENLLAWLGQQEKHIIKQNSQLKAYQKKLDVIKSLDITHDRLVNQLSRELSPLLLLPEVEPTFSPVNGLEKCIQDGDSALQRLMRLQNLLLRLGIRLTADADQVPEVLKSQRKLNKEITKQTKELTDILANLTDSLEDSPERNKNSALLSTLMARMERLAPRAEKTQGELDRLRLNLSRNIQRGHNWQKAWRQAGKEERAQLDQARAMVEELRQERASIAEKADFATEQAGEALCALKPLFLEELLPSLAGIVQKICTLDTRAESLEDHAEKLSQDIPLPRGGNLAKTPLALKPHSAALRRLSGKNILLDELEAGLETARRWWQKTSGEMMQAIIQPLEEKAQKLDTDLDQISREKLRLEKEKKRKQEESLRLARQLSQKTDQAEKAQQELARTQNLARNQEQNLTQYHKQLKNLGQKHKQTSLALSKNLELTERLQKRLKSSDNKARELDQRLNSVEKDYQETASQLSETKALSHDLEERLSNAGRLAEGLAARLDHSRRLSKALKAKLLEKHHHLKHAHKEIRELEYLRNYSAEQDEILAQTRAELEAARLEHTEAKKGLIQAELAREESLKELARERSARAREALDLLGGKALAVELAASEGEAGRWVNLAQDLALALVLNGQAHEEQTARLREQLNRLASEAAQLKRQLNQVSGLVNHTPVSDPVVGLRVTPLDPDQLYRAMTRLGRARENLRRIGRSTLGHWALIAALTSSLVLVPPSAPSKATRSDTPITEPKPLTRSIVQKIDQGPHFEVPVSTRILDGPLGRGSLNLDLLPIKDESTPLPPAVKDLLNKTARNSGLSPQVLLTSARAIYAGQEVVDANVLGEITNIANDLAERHPLIFRELARKGLPANTSDLTTLNPLVEKGQHLFMDRLYREYRSLGFSPEEALGALAANERAIANLQKMQPLPKKISGKVTPLNSVEELKLGPYLKRMVPYIESRLKIFLRQRGMVFSGDIKRYANNLAFDMYCAAKRFEVPLTFLLSIAHQETWYANVLGDQNRSASPFQIFEPTRKLIRHSMKEAGFVPPPAGIKLERHLTMATYMAAFHVRELMAGAIKKSALGIKGKINSNRVMLRYNGSKAYIEQVALRQKQLAKFMRSQKGT